MTTHLLAAVALLLFLDVCATAKTGSASDVPSGDIKVRG
jgi:hypothetical protein